jgi:lipopolysaccharide export system protein LptA
MDAHKAILYLREDNTVDHIVAGDGVSADIKGSAPIQARASQAKFTMNSAQDGFSRAVLSGDVQLDSAGERPSRVNAGRVLVDFASRNQVEKIHAEQNVKLVELASAREANTGKPVSGRAAKVPAGGDGGSSTSAASNGQQIEISSPAMDFLVAEGKRLARAETSSPASITVLPVPSDGSSTTVTAAKFVAMFDNASRLSSVHGAPDARVVSAAAGQPERASTSQQIDATFRPTGGIDAVVQQGNVQYVDGERQARADRARYTPADQMLELTGSPRVTDHGLTTTAHTVRMNRGTGDATAEGNVKSAYSELREQPNGALLAAASPIHVTAHTMTAHRSSSLAVYSGNARLWQDANVVEAPTIEFDRDHRSVVAQGDGQPVSTVLVQIDKHGNATPVSITSKRLTYTDDEHRAHFDGGVTARGADVTVTAQHVDAYLVPRGQATTNPTAKGQGQLERLVAEGGVVVQEPARQATGEKLTYTTSDDRFVLTGGSPSIFDAEHGKIRGDSLTFFRHDDRVLVEGRDSSPTVTQTRVAR